MKNDIVIAIVGSGGDGVISAGEILAKAAAHEGLYVFMTKSYGPQIRGGESSCRIRLSHDRILTPGDEIDALLVFQWQDFHCFREEYTLSENCIVFVDEKDVTPEAEIPIPRHLLANIRKIPFEKIAMEKAGTKLAKNMALIGSLIELVNWPEIAVQTAIKERFKRKGEEAITANLTAVESGKDYVRYNCSDGVDLKLDYRTEKPKFFMTGNEALSFGALKAGCRFYAGYPITPASEILEWFSVYMPRFGGTVIQSEDEIAAAGMAIGASFAGVKAMCGTSGPGMSLKSEMIGLASMAEIPLVVVDVQRTGPSTGIPTRTEQADLAIAVNGSHGDAPRVVLAPVDVEDCYFIAAQAFNIAEKFQIPVIILSDQFLAQRKESFDFPESIELENCSRIFPSEEQLKNYERYRMGLDSGVSPMSVPGITKGEYTAVGIEHDVYGNPSSSTEMHTKMSEKRASKLESIAENYPLLRVYGSSDAEVALIGWGSTKGIIREITESLSADGATIKGIVPGMLHPLPVQALTNELRGVKYVFVVEQTHSGQFLKHLRSYLDLPGRVYHYRRAGGNPLTIREVVEFITSTLTNGELRTTLPEIATSPNR